MFFIAEHIRLVPAGEMRQWPRAFCGSGALAGMLKCKQQVKINISVGSGCNLPAISSVALGHTGNLHAPSRGQPPHPAINHKIHFNYLTINHIEKKGIPSNG